MSKKAKLKTTRPGGGASAKSSGTTDEPIPPKRGYSVTVARGAARQLPPKPSVSRGGGKRTPLPPKRGLGSEPVPDQPIKPKPDGSLGSELPQLPPKPDGTRGSSSVPVSGKRALSSPPLPPKPDGSMSVGVHRSGQWDSVPMPRASHGRTR
jgi:hypothetical protein